MTCTTVSRSGAPVSVAALPGEDFADNGKNQRTQLLHCSFTHCSRKAKSLSVVLAAIFTLSMAEADTGERVRIVGDPYAESVWSGDRQKANLHTHTTVSDGEFHPHKVIDMYREDGYQILALSDHNRVTYPWTALPGLSISSLTERRIEAGELDPGSLQFESRNPDNLGMVAITGNELSSNHHKVSLFSDLEMTGSDDREEFEAIRRAGGLSFLAHPARYGLPPEWYLQLFNEFEGTLVGIEISNKTRPVPRDVKLWDMLLSARMPSGPVWGFVNDDMHRQSQFAFNRLEFALGPDPLTPDAIRMAVTQGNFYLASLAYGELAPRIDRIEHNEDEGSLTIHSADAEEIRWVSAYGAEVHTGPTIAYRDHGQIDLYLRAELVSASGGKTFTQPYSVVRERDWSDKDGNRFRAALLPSRDNSAGTLTFRHRDGWSFELSRQSLSMVDSLYLIDHQARSAAGSAAGRERFEVIERERGGERRAALDIVSLTESELVRYTGEYFFGDNPFLPEGTVLDVSADQQFLLITTVDGTVSVSLMPTGDDTFYARSLDADVVFVSESDGEIPTSFVIRTSDGAVTANRTESN